MTSLICNAPFCENTRNKNHAWCPIHRWERHKFKVKVYKELLPLWSVKRCEIHGLLRKHEVRKNHKIYSCKACIKTNWKPYDSIAAKNYNERYTERRKDRRLKKRYKTSLEEYNSILFSQKNVCAICKGKSEFDKRLNKERALAVDHCHKTNKNRGILCFKCNSLLGYAKDSIPILQQAIKYLSHYKSGLE